jgi:5-dehydro-2-deoxygluconokinase
LPYDLITMGRVGVDLYPEQIGVPLAEVRTFAKSLGGSATNVAVAAARLGARAAVITKVGDDPFGPYVRGALRGFGVDDAFVGTHPALRTPVVFCEIFPPDDFPLLFYREPTAPDMTIATEELDLDAIRTARMFWTTGTGLSAEPSRTATLVALEARSEVRGVTVHDLDHRPMFWGEEDDAGAWARAALAHATVAVGNRDEVAVAVGTREPDEAAEALLELGVQLAIVKRGPTGFSRARARSGSRCRPSRSTSSTASAPATRSAARSCTASCPAGRWSARSGSRTRRARTSRAGSPAPTRCRRSTTWKEPTYDD